MCYSSTNLEVLIFMKKSALFLSTIKLSLDNVLCNDTARKLTLVKFVFLFRIPYIVKPSMYSNKSRKSCKMHYYYKKIK